KALCRRHGVDVEKYIEGAADGHPGSFLPHRERGFLCEPLRDRSRRSAQIEQEEWRAQPPGDPIYGVRTRLADGRPPPLAIAAFAPADEIADRDQSIAQ